MKINKLSLFAIGSLFMVSCGSEPTEDTPTESAPLEKSTEMVCTYSYDASTTKLSWTSFKTSDKVAVGGTFNDYKVENTVASNSESAVFENASFTILSGSVNSGNEERDPKLVTFFFNTMISSDTISGHVVKISEALDGKGEAVVAFTMNGLTHEQNASYTLVEDVITLSTTLNMDNWEANGSIESLNKECKDLHTGADGISKLWNEVDVEISTILTKTCE